MEFIGSFIECYCRRSVDMKINPMLGFQSFQSANKTLKGIEAMNMIKKGQIKKPKLLWL